MIIFGCMDARRRRERFGAKFLCVALVCALVIGSSDANRRALRSIVKNDEVYGLWNGEIDEHLAERIWSNCREEVMLMKDYVPDLNFFLVWEASGEANSETALLKKRYWHVVVNSVSPEVKQALLLCAFNAQRLHIVKRPNAMLQTRSLFSDFSPVPPLSRSPIGAPALVPSSSPSLSPSFSFSPPAETPKESPPPPLIKSAPPPVVESTSRGPPRKPNLVSPSATDDVEARKKKVLIALIALMSVMTIILAALLLYLLKNRKNRHGPKYPLKDDKPLLNLSSGNLSHLLN